MSPKRFGKKLLKKSSNKKSSSNHSSPEFDRLEAVIRLMEQNGLAEIEWHHGEEKIRLKSGLRNEMTSKESSFSNSGSYAQTSDAGLGVPTVISRAALAPLAPAQVALAKGPDLTHPRAKQVTSPFVGTFYRSPSPEAEPYVREGQFVKKGDTLCIIEAMKLMNEIEAEFSGKIITVLMDNGTPVEFGEPLYLIEPQD